MWILVRGFRGCIPFFILLSTIADTEQRSQGTHITALPHTKISQASAMQYEGFTHGAGPTLSYIVLVTCSMHLQGQKVPTTAEANFVIELQS